MIITEYINGNTTCQILEDGTKIREFTGTPRFDFPESIDIKITNYCDLGCLYCHESSDLRGKHGNLEKTWHKVKFLPAGVELAIGGGNPLSHPDLKVFLQKCKEKGIICNLTVNQGHLLPGMSLLKELIEGDLVKGIGVSITSRNWNKISELRRLTPNVVYHVIAGVNPPEVIDDLISLGPAKVLVLGYKQWGLGREFWNPDVEGCLSEWNMRIRGYFGKCVISFDNLAIEQLKIKRHFTEKKWGEIFMGEDFSHSMYIDAVEGVLAPTSRSPERENWEQGIIEYFQKNSTTWKN
jgi:hypothetical protein